MPNKASKHKTVLLLTVVCLIAISILLVPAFDANKLQRANEATAVARLRLLTSAEKEYAREHVADGYACDLAKLEPRAHTTDVYDSEFYLNGTAAGYQFAILGCESSGSGVRKYRILAAPTEPGKSGWRSFCSDETGVLRYTLEAPPNSCFNSRSVIDFGAR